MLLSLLSESEFVIICADMNSLVGGADPGLRALDPVWGNVTKTSAETNLPQEVGGPRPSAVNPATKTTELRNCSGVNAVLMTLKRVTLCVLADCLYQSRPMRGQVRAR